MDFKHCNTRQYEKEIIGNKMKIKYITIEQELIQFLI